MKIHKKKGKRTLRQGTENLTCRTDSHTPSFPMEKKEKHLLSALKNCKELRFSVRNYALLNKIARSTVYDLLKKLENKCFVKKENYGCWQITHKGNSVFTPVGNSRLPCRNDQLSSHFQTFKLPLKNKDKFNLNKLLNANPNNHKELKLMNLTINYFYFDDVTLILKPKVLEINIKEIISNSIEESTTITLNTALKYIDLLTGCGLTFENIVLDKGHYARVQSHLADFLKNIDNRYKLDLGNGKKFWIDCSDKLEDETNDIDTRERLDTFLTDALSCNSLMSDIGKMKEVLGTIIKLKVMDTITNTATYPTIERDYNYFG